MEEMTTTAGCTGQNRSDQRCRSAAHKALHAAADLKSDDAPPQQKSPPPVTGLPDAPVSTIFASNQTTQHQKDVAYKEPGCDFFARLREFYRNVIVLQSRVKGSIWLTRGG